MKICLWSYANYNAGGSNWKWVELPIGEDELEKVYKELGGEEHFICDYDVPFGLKIDENESIELLNELEDSYQRCGYDAEDVDLIISHHGSSDIQEIIDMLDEQDIIALPNIYTKKMLGEYLVDNDYLGEIPEHLENYIDYAAVGYDFCLGEWYVDSDGATCRY